MRQFTAVVNPTAGGSTSAAALHRIARLLREAGAGLETEYSRSLAHARELARLAGQRGRVVLAVGGTRVTRPEVRILRGREILISADRDMPHGADGEVEAPLPVMLRVLPGALRVLC